VRVLVDGLVRAQREVEKMGARLGTVNDGAGVRDTVRDYLAKVQQAQAEVQLLQRNNKKKRRPRPGLHAFAVFRKEWEEEE
jgi:hypothetical protein